MCTELKALKNAIVPALQHASEIEKIVPSHRPDLCMIKDVNINNLNTLLNGDRIRCPATDSGSASQIADILKAVVAGKVREIAIACEVGDSVLYQSLSCAENNCKKSLRRFFTAAYVTDTATVGISQVFSLQLYESHDPGQEGLARVAQKHYVA
jgi:hypothetical protein